MSNFYYISYVYSPTSAQTVRTLAFMRVFSQLGIKLTWVFILPSLNYDKLDENLPGITVKYLWNSVLSKNKYLKHLYKHISFFRFISSLKKEDKVFVYGCPAFIRLLVNKVDNVYQEITEHPEAVEWPRKFNMDNYYKACLKLKSLFVISEALKIFFVQKGCEESHVHIINMTVDLKRFEGIKKQKVEEKYIAYCGTASNTKDGVDDLIKAFSKVSIIHPEYKLYIIGRTPSKDERFGNLKLVQNLGIEGKVVFTGMVSPKDMPQLLKNAEILALDRPNSLQAQCGFPTKLGEYLLTANPVVVTKVGDIPKFLYDGVSALLSEDRNSTQFAEKICFAIENPNIAKTIGLNGKNVAANNFNSFYEGQKLAKLLNL